MTYTETSASNSLAVLQHIREILPTVLPLNPKYQIGTWVKTVQKYDDVVFTSVGIICGFEFLCHPDVVSGWFYVVANESALVFSQGRLPRDCEFQIVEVFSESEVFLLD